MLFLIGLGGFAGDEAEVLMEAGEVGEATFEAKLFDADTVVEQEFAGVADADLVEELGVGLAGSRFEVAAEGIGDESGDGCDLVEIDLLVEMTEGIVVDRVDPVVLRFGKIGPEADGGEELKAVGGGESGQAFDQCGNPAGSVGEADLFNVFGYCLFLPRVDEDSAAGFLQQISDWFGLG